MNRTGYHDVQSLVKNLPINLRATRKLLKRGVEWGCIETIAARLGKTSGTVQQHLLELRRRGLSEQNPADVNKWRCAAPGESKNDHVTAFNAECRATADVAETTLAERVFELLHDHPLMAARSVARRLGVSPERAARALLRLSRNGEVLRFGQRHVIARAPHHPRPEELAAAGRWAELDEIVVAAIDRAVTHANCRYVTLKQLIQSTGLPRHRIRASVSRLSANDLSKLAVVRVHGRGRPVGVIRRPDSREAFASLVPREGWIELGQLLSVRPDKTRQWLKELVVTGLLEVSPPRRRVSPEVVDVDRLCRTGDPCFEPLPDPSCLVKLSNRGLEHVSAINAGHGLPGTALVKGARPNRVLLDLEAVIRRPCDAEIAAVKETRLDRLGLERLERLGRIAYQSGAIVLTPFGGYLLAVAQEERRLRGACRGVVKPQHETIGALPIGIMIGVVGRIRAGVPAPPWFVPAWIEHQLSRRDV